MKTKTILLAAGTQCLLLETKSGNFLTESKNMPCLIELAKTFGFSMAVVELEKAFAVDDLPTLVTKLNVLHEELPSYKIVEYKIKPPKTKKELALEVHDFIRKTILDKKSITLIELCEKFTDMEESSLAKFLSRAVQRLNREGTAVQKNKPGHYSLL